MKFLLKAVACAVLVSTGYALASFAPMSGSGTTRVLYSLDAKRNDQEVVRLIDAADQYAYFAIYTFTLPDIAQALARAKRRGVDVRGIVDRQQAALKPEEKVLETLREARVPVEAQKHPMGIMHMKLLVTDKAYAVGSYNWTRAATDVNDEVLEVGADGAARLDYLTILRRVLETNR